MFGQRDDATETTRQRLLWTLWAGLVVAMAVSLVFFSNLLGAISDTMEERSERHVYQEWLSHQLDLDFLGLQDTLRLAREDGVGWNAAEVLEMGLADLADKALALQDAEGVAGFAAANPVVARLIEVQRRFLDDNAALLSSGQALSVDDINRMDVDLSELSNLRRILVQDLMQSELVIREADNSTLQTRLRTFYTGGSAVLIFLAGLLVVNVFMLTMLRQRRQALDRAMHNMRTIVEAPRDAVFLTREDLTISGMGRSGETMFGLSEEDAQGRKLFDFFANDPSEFELFAEALRDSVANPADEAKRSYRIELNGRRQDGTTFPADVGFSVVQDPENNTAYVVSVADMSDQAERELSLMQARNEALQAERAKSRFLAAMSHEMRTPLNGVLASLDLMRETTTLDERQTELVGIIERCGDDALEQVENVLELTRLDTLANTAINVAPFAPAAQLREIVDTNQQRARQNRNTLRFDSTVPDNLLVTGSAILFRQIMHNFVSNAIKFTSGGEIHAKLTAADLGEEIEFTATVQDTGIGIEEEDLDRIFRNFETIRDSYSHFRSGTGLGLSIAKHSADLLNGRIDVDSNPGQGSSFTLVVRWPKGDSNAAGEDGLWGPQRSEANDSMDVLVVEDNEINRQMLVDMLQAKGHQATQAVDGLEGVSAGRERQFDLILMDISMPKLDGVGATRMLRQFGKSRHSPIVAVTAHSQPEHMREFLAAGMDRVLTKPLRMATLEQLFEDMGHVANTNSSAEAAPVAVQDETEQEDDEMAEDLIEKEVFDGLIDMLGGESVVGYLSQFENDAKDMLPKYTDAIDAGDFATARAEAHRCAGGAAVIGAGKVHEVLQSMTHSADASDSEKCLALAAGLEDLTRKTMDAMRATIG